MSVARYCDSHTFTCIVAAARFIRHSVYALLYYYRAVPGRDQEEAIERVWYAQLLSSSSIKGHTRTHTHSHRERNGEISASDREDVTQAEAQGTKRNSGNLNVEVSIIYLFSTPCVIVA